MAGPRRKKTFSDADWGLGGNKPAPEPQDASVPPPPNENPSTALVPATSPGEALPSVPSQDPGIDFSKLSPEAKAFVGASLAPSTVRSYAYHWRVFDRWCRLRGKPSQPADAHLVADYVSFRALHGIPDEESAEDRARDEAQREKGGTSYVPRRTYQERWKPSTLRQGLAAIRLMHRFNGHANPCDAIVVEQAMRGVAATVGARPERKAPLLDDALERALTSLGTDLEGLRNKAMILVGFAGALRRGELAAVEVADFTQDASGKGLRLDLRRHFSDRKVTPGTKTNRSGREIEAVGIPFGAKETTCPVRALQAWLEAAKITEGRVFRAVRKNTVGEPITPQTVALTVKSVAEAIGLDPKNLAGHSLRSGLATSAHRKGTNLLAIQRKGRWKNLDMLARYIREAGLFEQDAAEGLL